MCFVWMDPPLPLHPSSYLSLLSTVWIQPAWAAWWCQWNMDAVDMEQACSS